MSFIPRRCIDKDDGELVRALRFNGKQAEFISFKMPKRFGQVLLSRDIEFDQNTYQEWAQGNIAKDQVYKDYEN